MGRKLEQTQTPGWCFSLLSGCGKKETQNIGNTSRNVQIVLVIWPEGFNSEHDTFIIYLSAICFLAVVGEALCIGRLKGPSHDRE